MLYFLQKTVLVILDVSHIYLTSPGDIKDFPKQVQISNLSESREYCKISEFSPVTSDFVLQQTKNVRRLFLKCWKKFLY